MKENSKLFVCYSKPLREYLFQHGIRYEIGGKHMETNCPFWVYLRNEELNKVLESWGHR